MSLLQHNILGMLISGFTDYLLIIFFHERLIIKGTAKRGKSARKTRKNIFLVIQYLKLGSYKPLFAAPYTLLPTYNVGISVSIFKLRSKFSTSSFKEFKASNCSGFKSFVFKASFCCNSLTLYPNS